MTTIGLVSAGLLTFPQGLGLVFGANVGTKGTGWLLAIIGVRVSLSSYALPMIFVGALGKLLASGRLAAAGGSSPDSRSYFMASPRSKRAWEVSPNTCIPGSSLRCWCSRHPLPRRTGRSFVSGRRRVGRDGGDAVVDGCDCRHTLSESRNGTSYRNYEAMPICRAVATWAPTLVASSKPQVKQTAELTRGPRIGLVFRVCHSAPPRRT